jgi:hypothetical protein
VPEKKYKHLDQEMRYLFPRLIIDDISDCIETLNKVEIDENHDDNSESYCVNLLDKKTAGKDPRTNMARYLEKLGELELGRSMDSISPKSPALMTFDRVSDTMIYNPNTQNILFGEHYAAYKKNDEIISSKMKTYGINNKFKTREVFVTDFIRNEVIGSDGRMVKRMNPSYIGGKFFKDDYRDPVLGMVLFLNPDPSIQHHVFKNDPSGRLISYYLDLGIGSIPARTGRTILHSIEEGIMDKDERIDELIALINDKRIPPDSLDVLSFSPDIEIREELACSDRLPSRVQEKLAVDEERGVRDELARCTNDYKILEILKNDPDKEIRKRSNKRYMNVLFYSFNDPDPDTANFARSKGFSLVVEKLAKTKSKSSIKNLCNKILDHFFNDPDPVRRGKARSIIEDKCKII